MPKLKTNKAMKKRFKVTKNKKVLGSSSLRRHMLTDRTPKNRRQARGLRVLEVTDGKKVIEGLPYDK